MNDFLRIHDDSQRSRPLQSCPLLPKRLVALVSMLWLAGCGHTSGSEPPAASISQEPSSLNLLLSSEDIEGEVLSASADPSDATIVVFFASWCGPCRHELGLLGQLRESESNLNIIGVNAYEEWGRRSDSERLASFLEMNAPWLRVVRSSPELMKSFGGVPKIPTLFVFDRYANLVEVFRREHRPPPQLAELAKAVARARSAQ